MKKMKEKEDIQKEEIIKRDKIIKTLEKTNVV